MTSPSAVLTDVRPLFLTRPDAVTSAGLEFTELAASAGLILDPWQVDVLDIALGERADGQWAAREIGLVVPRQNGKGAILEALELGWLFLTDEALIMHSSHEFKTSAEAYLRVKSLIVQTPDLDRRVHKFYNAHGSEGIELTNGHRLRFVARTAGSGRGFSGDKIVLDEAYNLSDRGVSALLPTMSARENPQVWLTSSAPLDGEASGVLRRFCKRGRAGAPTLAYIEYGCEESADLDDEAEWAKANPGFPHRIGREAIQLERGMLPAEDFARERLGIWVDPMTDGPTVIPAAEWAAGLSEHSEIVGTPSFALEVAEDRSWSAFASAGASSLGEFVHGEVVDYREGTGWCVARAVELKDRWGGKLAILKGSPAASLIEDLKRAGLVEDVDLVEVSTEDHARFCGQLLDAVVNLQFKHRDQPHLEVSIRGAVKREIGDVWVWSRRKSTVDISPLVAVTAAAGLHGLAKPTMAVPEVVEL